MTLQLDSFLWLLWASYWFYSGRSVQKTLKSEGILKRLSHLIPTALVFFLIFKGAALQFIPFYSWHSLVVEWLGVFVTLGGLLFAVWARIHLGRYWSGIITLKEGHKLIRTGPYALVRHPIYTGFLLALLGSALSAGTLDGLAGFFFIAMPAYIIKLQREETLLSAQFGLEYEDFKRSVPALVPGLSKGSRSGPA